MAFVISRTESTFSQTQKTREDKDSATVGAISIQLHLKSSLSSKASSQTLNKQVVLQRIRHRKSLNRIKSAFGGLLGSSEGNTASAYEHKWLQQDDAFSAP